MTKQGGPSGSTDLYPSLCLQAKPSDRPLALPSSTKWSHAGVARAWARVGWGAVNSYSFLTSGPSARDDAAEFLRSNLKRRWAFQGLNRSLLHVAGGLLCEQAALIQCQFLHFGVPACSRKKPSKSRSCCYNYMPKLR